MNRIRKKPIVPREVRKPVALRALLYEANWRRADLGRAMKVAPNTASAIFDGVRLIRLEEGYLLASAMTVALGRPVRMEDFVDKP